MHPDLWNGYYVGRCNSAYYRRRAAWFSRLDRGTRLVSLFLSTAVVANFVTGLPALAKLAFNVVVAVSVFGNMITIVFGTRDAADKLAKLAAGWDEITGRYERARIRSDSTQETLLQLGEAFAKLQSEDTAPRWNGMMVEAQSEVDAQLNIVRAGPGKSYPIQPTPPPPAELPPPTATPQPPIQAPTPTPAPAK